MLSVACSTAILLRTQVDEPLTTVNLSRTNHWVIVTTGGVQTKGECTVFVCSPHSDNITDVLIDTVARFSRPSSFFSSLLMLILANTHYIMPTNPATGQFSWWDGASGCSPRPSTSPENHDSPPPPVAVPEITSPLARRLPLTFRDAEVDSNSIAHPSMQSSPGLMTQQPPSPVSPRSDISTAYNSPRATTPSTYRDGAMRPSQAEPATSVPAAQPALPALQPLMAVPQPTMTEPGPAASATPVPEIRRSTTPVADSPPLKSIHEGEQASNANPNIWPQLLQATHRIKSRTSKQGRRQVTNVDHNLDLNEFVSITQGVAGVCYIFRVETESVCIPIASKSFAEDVLARMVVAASGSGKEITKTAVSPTMN